MAQQVAQRLVQLGTCLGIAGVALQLGRCMAQTGGTDKATAGLQPVQVLGQAGLVAGGLGLGNGIAHPWQLAHEQPTQCLEVVLLAIECKQGTLFIPGRQLPDRTGRQRSAHAAQQRIAAHRLDQHILETLVAQPAGQRGTGIGGMRQGRGVRLVVAQLGQQAGAIAIGQVDIDQPQVVAVVLGTAQGGPRGIGAVHFGGQGFQGGLEKTAAYQVVLDQKQAGQGYCTYGHGWHPFQVRQYCDTSPYVATPVVAICDNGRPFVQLQCAVARSRSRIDKTPFQTEILDLSHDGRGVARRDGEGGKVTFITGALPGETVMAVQSAVSRHFDEARTESVVTASPDRVQPRCAHFGVCAGCVLQHLAEDQQIVAKQRVLTENLQRIGHVSPETVLPALVGESWGYRRKGRFSVRRVEKKDKTLVGFRELDPRFVADIAQCHTVIPEIGGKVAELSAFIETLDGKRDIPQIEFIGGDAAIALTVRHLQPLSQADQDAWVAFGQQHGFAIYLQPGGLDTVRPLWPAEGVPLSFALEPWNVELAFKPLDFIQVNAKLNVKMIERALELLDAQPGERVLDLFCGLGNFTLPLARGVAQVVGVECDAGLVARARENAQRNGLDNAEFFAADLTQDQRSAPWMAQGFDKLLLDPPRSGAIDVLQQLPLEQFKRIVYVSCHPGSLARDAGYLVNERGFTLVSAGAMDMFPHTAHVESIAVFEKR